MPRRSRRHLRADDRRPAQRRRRRHDWPAGALGAAEQAATKLVRRRWRARRPTTSRSSSCAPNERPAVERHGAGAETPDAAAGKRTLSSPGDTSWRHATPSPGDAIVVVECRHDFHYVAAGAAGRHARRLVDAVTTTADGAAGRRWCPRAVTLAGRRPAARAAAAGTARPPSAPAPARAPQPPPATAPAAPVAATRRVVFLGDSLTAGLGAADRAGVSGAHRRSGSRPRGKGWTVVNAGVSGDTSAGGLRRLDWSIDGGAAIVVVALGGNDALRGLPADDLERNLDAIVTRAKASAARAWYWPGWRRRPTTAPTTPRASARRYTDRRATPRCRPRLPFLLDGVAGDSSSSTRPTAFIPNQAGARRVAETVWRVLEPHRARD